MDIADSVLMAVTSRTTGLIVSTLFGLGALLGGCSEPGLGGETPAIDGSGKVDSPSSGDATFAGDAGVTRDAQAADAPPPPDATPPRDGGPSPDASMPRDGGTLPDAAQATDGGVLPPGTLPANTQAAFRIIVTDIWGQTLAAKPTVDLIVNGRSAAPSDFPKWIIPLPSGNFSLTASSTHHHDLVLNFNNNGSGNAGALTIVQTSPGGPAGVAKAFVVTSVLGVDHPIPVYTVAIGLRHKWFSASGAPARYGNRVTLFTSGEEAWGTVATALAAATESIHVATWWWESNFELVRPPAAHLTASRAQHDNWTVMRILEQSAAKKRVLVNQLWGQDGALNWVTTDGPLRAHGSNGSDNFEFMGQGNLTQGSFNLAVKSFSFANRVPWLASYGTPEPAGLISSTVPARFVNMAQIPLGVSIEHASMHQKFIVIDDKIAFIGGMNIKAVDWDTDEHRVFEPRRMPVDASVQDRYDVRDKKETPATGPRKDYMVRVEGPSVRDAQEVFQERWQYNLDTSVTYSGQATPVVPKPAPASQPGGVQMQVTTTLPMPFHQNSILETWVNAVSQANNFIYIEDQYFRSTLLSDAITARMRVAPNLKLIVITNPMNEWTDPGCFWTYKTMHELAANFPGRVATYQLRSYDSHVTWGIDETDAEFVDMDLHAKMLIVDDIYLNVGSANKNNRGVLYEAEMNATILNADWVRAARRRIFANLLPPGTPATDDPLIFWRQFNTAAAENDAIRGRWDDEGDDLNLNGAAVPNNYLPKGFLYSLPRPVATECFIEDIGPDVM